MKKKVNSFLGSSSGTQAEHEGPLQGTKAMLRYLEHSSLTVTWLTPVGQWWDRGQNPNHPCGLCSLPCAESLFWSPKGFSAGIQAPT